MYQTSAVVSIDSNIAKIIIINLSDVLLQCADKDVVFDFSGLESTNTCKITAQSGQALERSKDKLTCIIDSVVVKPVHFSKFSYIAWLESSPGQEKLKDIDQLSKTVSDMQIRLKPSNTPMTASRSVTSSPPPAYAYTPTIDLAASNSSSATGDVHSVPSDIFEMVEIVKKDIYDVKVDGMMSTPGSISQSIGDRRGVTLRDGFQKIRTKGGRQVLIYHTPVIPWEDSGTAKMLLGEKIREAYEHLKEAKTIAYPAIGTGNLKYPPSVVAAVMISAVFDCLMGYQGGSAVKKVMLVIYPSDDMVYEIFKSELKKYKPGSSRLDYGRPHVTPPTYGPSSRSAPPPVPCAPSRSGLPSGSGFSSTSSPSSAQGSVEGLTVTISGLRLGDVDGAIDRLRKELKQSVVCLDFSNSPYLSCIKNLNEDEMKNIMSMASDKSVDIQFMLSVDNIVVEGVLKDANFVREKISKMLHQKFEFTSGKPDRALPESWDRTALAMGQYQVRVDRGSQEFFKVSEIFKETSGEAGIDIVELIRVQNEHLYRLYEARRDQVREELGNNTITSERQLWHGTTEETVQLICTNGFNRTFAGKNATLYGKGCYFATTSEYSIGYAKGAYQKYIILVKVVTGRFYLGNPSIDGASLIQGYHSTVDNETSPNKFVVYHDAAAYPEYVISFSRR